MTPTPSTKSAEALPELPKPYYRDVGHTQVPWYSPEQMRAAILADRTARAAAPVQSVGEDEHFCALVTDAICHHGFPTDVLKPKIQALLDYIDSLLAARPSAAPEDTTDAPRLKRDSFVSDGAFSTYVMELAQRWSTYTLLKESTPAAQVAVPEEIHDRQAMTYAEMLALVATHSQAEPVSHAGAMGKVEPVYKLTRSILHDCPALVLPQSFLQKLGMTAQIVVLKGASQEIAEELLATLNSAQKGVCNG